MAPPDVEGLLQALTLEQKLSLLAGASQWRTMAIPSLGFPALKVSDGPSGARGEVFGEGVPAAFIPSGVSLGATWDVDLVRELGALLAEECRSKSSSVLLAPTMCMHRHPLGGRNFESFSEDPYLTGRLATAHVQGLQGAGIGATPKHFVANDQETKRFKVNAHIDPRTLREIYLLPFQMVVREADPWCMMTAYNKVNGYHADASKKLLIDIARDEWLWKGVFMSDWGGTTSSVDSINNGLDLEMPGPPAARSWEVLQKPIEQGLVRLDRVDASVRRILRLLQRAGRFQDARDEPEYCRDMDAAVGSSSTSELLRRAASSGIVMLKNENHALPIHAGTLSKLVIIGPNAKRIVAGGGGSSYIKAPYWTSVFGSARAHYEAQGVEVHHHVGAKVNRFVPTPAPGVAKDPHNGHDGASIEWHTTHDLEDAPVATSHIDDLYFMGFGDVPPEVGRLDSYSFIARTVLTPITSGRHTLSLASIGPATLFLDDEPLLERSGSMDAKGPLFFTYGSDEVVATVDMVAGRPYQVRVEYHSHDRQLRPEEAVHLEPMEDKFQGFRIGFEEYDPTDRPLEASHLARDCDAAIVVVGRDKEWETESQDIPHLELPGEQVRLIQELASACRRVVVIVQAGTPVITDPWIDDVDAVLYTWYQGQELGNAALDVLAGHVNPSGRLPVTFPKRLQDCPAYSSFPGEQNESYYTEGLHIGHRWWDLVGTMPAFPIGFGLSYNTFSLEPSSISATSLGARPEDKLSMYVTVTNRGGSDLPGRETVLVWCAQEEPRRLARPVKQICGFAKSKPLHADEAELVEVTTDGYAFGMWDPSRGTWVIDRGAVFTISIGRTALDAVPTWTVVANEEVSWLK